MNDTAVGGGGQTYSCPPCGGNVPVGKNRLQGPSAPGSDKQAKGRGASMIGDTSTSWSADDNSCAGARV